MAAFLLRRFIYLVLLVIVSTSVAYVLAATQLNPRSRYEGRNPPPPPEVVDAVLDAVNMNNKTPLVDRFGRWAGGVIRGDLGRTDRQHAGQRGDRPPDVGEPAAAPVRRAHRHDARRRGRRVQRRQAAPSRRSPRHGVLVRHAVDPGGRARRALQERRHRR